MKAFSFAALLALALPIAAEATVIDFTGFANGTPVDQSFGDVAGVLDVSYGVFGGALGANPTLNSDTPVFWGFGYEGCSVSCNSITNEGALIGPYSGDFNIQVTLQALGGNMITQFSTALAYWTGIDNFALSVAAYDQDGNQIFAFDNTTTPGLIGVGPLISSGWSTVVLQLGDDWYVGIRSIDYTVNDMAAVPVPAAGFLLLAGLGGLAALRRRKVG